MGLAAAIRPDMRPGNDLVGQRVGKLAHALYGSRSVLKQGIPASFDDLARYPLCSLTQDLPHFTTSTWWKEIATALSQRQCSSPTRRHPWPPQ